MVEIYWYISRPKVEFLKGRGWSLDEISVGLKALWFEAGAKLHADAGLVRDLEKVKRALESRHQIPEFRSISPGNAPDIFSFKGEAARMISQGGFWAAMATGDSALLLAGSAANVIGGGTAEGGFPFTNDPVGAVRTLLEGSPQDQWMLSKAWQTVMEGPFKAQSLARPRVEGLGLFAGMFTVDKSETAGTSFPDVRRIVVGSPLYIKQV